MPRLVTAECPAHFQVGSDQDDDAYDVSEPYLATSSSVVVSDLIFQYNSVTQKLTDKHITYK